MQKIHGIAMGCSVLHKSLFSRCSTYSEVHISRVPLNNLKKEKNKCVLKRFCFYQTGCVFFPPFSGKSVFILSSQWIICFKIISLNTIHDDYGNLLLTALKCLRVV